MTEIAGRHDLLEKYVSDTMKKVDFNRLKSDEAGEYLFGILWDAFDSGWGALSEQSGLEIDGEKENCRDRVICEVNGFKYTYGGLTYIYESTPDGSKKEFLLEYLPGYKHIEALSTAFSCINNDDKISALSQSNKEVMQCLAFIERLVKKLYWKKVVDAIEIYHIEKDERSRARLLLRSNGFNESSIDSLIPLIVDVS